MSDSIEGFRGKILRDGDEGYDAAKGTFNNSGASIKPKMVVQPADAEDVAAVIKHAVSTKTKFTIRSGGHNCANSCLCDDIVLDLANFKTVKYKSDTQTLEFGAGCQLDDLTNEMEKHKRSVATGSVGITGVGGLTLGGGWGNLARKEGLAMDNLVSIEIVLADGTITTASESENSDLFWALRGGGRGNFGVVTKFECKTFDYYDCYGGCIVYAMPDASDDKYEICKAFGKVLQNTKDMEDKISMVFVVHPPGEATLFALCMCDFSMDTEEKGLEPMKPFDKYKMDPNMKFGPTDWATYNRIPMVVLMNPPPPPSRQYWVSGTCPDITGEKGDSYFENLAKHMMSFDYASHPTSLSVFEQWGGKASSIAKESTFSGARGSDFAWVTIFGHPMQGPETDEARRTAAREFASAINSHAAGSGKVYVNYMMEDDGFKENAGGDENMKKALAIKKKYDPNNVFNMGVGLK